MGTQKRAHAVHEIRGCAAAKPAPVDDIGLIGEWQRGCGVVGPDQFQLTGTSVSQSMVAASTRPWPAISSPSSATMQGTVHPNLAMLPTIFASWSSPCILALRA